MVPSDVRVTSDVTSMVTSTVCGTIGVMSADDNQYRVYCETPIEGRYVVIFNSQPVEMTLCEVMVNAGKPRIYRQPILTCLQYLYNLSITPQLLSIFFNIRIYKPNIVLHVGL